MPSKMAPLLKSPPLFSNLSFIRRDAPKPSVFAPVRLSNACIDGVSDLANVFQRPFLVLFSLSLGLTIKLEYLIGLIDLMRDGRW